MNKFPIIALDHTRWKGNWMNRQHILSRLGDRGWPIIYSNGARFYNELNDGGFFSHFEYVNNIYTFSAGYLLPRNYKLKKLDTFAIDFHCKQLKNKLQIKQNDFFIVICFNPDFYPYIARLSPKHTYFHIYDVYKGMEGNADLQNNAQKRLVDESTIISAASDQMWDNVVGKKNINKNIIPNGVDFDFFAKSTQSSCQQYKEIQAIPGFKIGYIGTINSKIDFQLIYELAIINPEIQFILGGNVRHKQIDVIPELHKFYVLCTQALNIHFIGTVERADVPSILKLMDINAIFYHQNKNSWINAGYPIKINEYLAAGKPVITSYMPVLKSHFSDVVQICETKQQWISTIENTLSNKCADLTHKGLAIAKKNDWENRVDNVEKLLFSLK